MKIFYVLLIPALVSLNSCSSSKSATQNDKSNYYYYNANVHDQYLLLKAHNRSRWAYFDEYDRNSNSSTSGEVTIALYHMGDAPFGFYNSMGGFGGFFFLPFSGNPYYTDIYSPFGITGTHNYYARNNYYMWNSFYNPYYYFSGMYNSSYISYNTQIPIHSFNPYAGYNSISVNDRNRSNPSVPGNMNGMMTANDHHALRQFNSNETASNGGGNSRNNLNSARINNPSGNNNASVNHSFSQPARTNVFPSAFGTENTGRSFGGGGNSNPGGPSGGIAAGSRMSHK